MVEYINTVREEDAFAAGAEFPSKRFAELLHDHFMAKVPEVLGDLAPKFLGTSHYVNGAANKVPRPIYTFPKREACLMENPFTFFQLPDDMSLIYMVNG